MTLDIRTYLDRLVSSLELSRDKADCVYKEYVRIRDSYLAGRLDKSALDEMEEIRTALKDRITESSDLPSAEDVALFSMAKKICDSAARSS